MKSLKLLFVLAAVVAWHLTGTDMFSAMVGYAQGSCPVRGSCTVEPGLQGRNDLYLFEDFELANWQTHFTALGVASNLGNPTSPVFAGSRSGEVRVPTGQHDGASLELDFSSIGQADPDEVYFRYYVRFNDTWQLNGDGEIGKFPGFDAGSLGAGHGCSPSNGRNGWSARMMNFDRGSTYQVGFYTYHADMASSCGEHMVWPTSLERNRWYSVEARVRLNTISGSRGNNDGILQGWIDDQLVFTRTNIRFRDVSTIHVEKVWGNIYVGGSWTADRNMAIHFDNMVVARNRIGPATSGSTAPRPPTNLRIIG